MSEFKDQRTEALYWFEHARLAIGREAIDALDDVLGRAQNGPPDGAADGSIKPQLWTMLSGYVRSKRALAKAEGELESYIERCLVEFGDAGARPYEDDLEGV